MQNVQRLYKRFNGAGRIARARVATSYDKFYFELFKPGVFSRSPEVFRLKIPLRFSDASSGSGLTNFSPFVISIYLSSILTRLTIHAVQRRRAHRQSRCKTFKDCTSGLTAPGASPGQGLPRHTINFTLNFSNPVFFRDRPKFFG